jgi:tRNA A-37 threonylcarbamoyl transferase component Bud32
MRGPAERISTLLGGGRIVRTIFFPSKKNQVSLVFLRKGGGTVRVVAKFFVWGDISREAGVLEACRREKIRVPRILGRGGNLLLLEYLPGRSLQECLETDISESSLVSLAEWMSSFHAAFDDGKEVLLKGDLRFHNFIVSRGRLWGFDFEESVRGRREKDVAQLCVSFLGLGRGFGKSNYSACRKFKALYEKISSKSLEGLRREMVLELRIRAGYLPALADSYRRQAALLEEKGAEL